MTRQQIAAMELIIGKEATAKLIQVLEGSNEVPHCTCKEDVESLAERVSALEAE